MLPSAKSLNRTESLQKRLLHHLYIDHESLHNILLAKSGKVILEASRLSTL